MFLVTFQAFHDFWYLLESMHGEEMDSANQKYFECLNYGPNCKSVIDRDHILMTKVNYRDEIRPIFQASKTQIFLTIAITLSKINSRQPKCENIL